MTRTRRSHTWSIVAAAVVSAAAPAFAQMHHVDEPTQVTRAVGVYEWTGELDKPTAMRLVPVSVFLGGSMHDAGTYLARPVPFALETGNVYEIDFAGLPKGLLDVKMARDISMVNPGAGDPPPDATDGSWYGYGTFAPPTLPKPSKLKPTVNMAQIEGTGDDDRPHFVAARPETAAEPAKTTASRTPTGADDSERPTLRHRDDDSSTDELNPKEKKPKREKPQGYVTGVGDSLNDDPDRPTLHRGSKDSGDTPPLEGLPSDMHQAVALSDPRVRDDHEFARPWENAAERDALLAELTKIADPAVRAYMQANGLVPAPAGTAVLAAATGPSFANAPNPDGAPPKLVRTPNGISTATAPAPPVTPSKTTAVAKRKGSAKAAPMAIGPIVYDHQDLRGFFLSYGGLPTFVFTASMPVHAAKAVTADVALSVAIVAQRLPTGQLQVSLQSITDSGHLNRTPWMRFVDVVDADGSHRASMLFELRAAHARQFALYRLVSANAEQTFVTDPML